jgi:hypothetical protein
MMDNPLDPRRERLIALLYGELEAEEERRVRGEIESDERLRSDWEELQATRRMLQQWEVPDQPPNFVFVDEQESAARRVRSGILGGWRGRLRGLAPATSWVFATAALIVVSLALTDFHVQRSNGTLTIGFGGPSKQQLALGEPDDLDVSTAVPIEGLRPGQRGPAQTVSDVAQGVAPAPSPYVTREEFEAYNIGLTRTMVALLNEYDRQRDQDVRQFLQATFGGFADKQDRDYRDLRGRIEELTTGFSEEQYKDGVRIDYLMRQTQPGLVAPESDTTAGERKE